MNIFIISNEGYGVPSEQDNIQKMCYPDYKGLVVFLFGREYNDKNTFLKDYNPRKDCVILARPAETGGDEVTLSAILSPHSAQMKGADKNDYKKMEEFCMKMCRYLRDDTSDDSTYDAIQKFKLQYVEALKNNRS